MSVRTISSASADGIGHLGGETEALVLRQRPVDVRAAGEVGQPVAVEQHLLTGEVPLAEVGAEVVDAGEPAPDVVGRGVDVLLLADRRRPPPTGSPARRATATTPAPPGPCPAPRRGARPPSGPSTPAPSRGGGATGPAS